MALYRYQAIARSGEMLTGEQEGGSPDEVGKSLQAQGHFPLEVKPAGTSGRWRLPEFRLESNGRRPVALFTFELSVLLQAGFPVDRAIMAAAASVSDRPLRTALAKIADQVRGGTSFSDALRGYPKLFPPLYCALVEAGEASGALAVTLERLAEDLTKADEFRNAIGSALLYPGLLVTLAIMSLVFILLVVVPSFRPMLEQAGVELPWSMELLLLGSGALEAGGGALALLIAAGLGALLVCWNRPSFRLWRDGQALKLAGLRDIVTKTDTARLCRSLGLLLNNGAALTTAWRIAQGGLSNAVFQARLAGVGDRIAEGESFAQTLEQSGVVTPLAVHMLRVGEQSGRLGPMADQAAGLIERDVKRRLDRFLAVLVPALTIGIGAMIAFLIATVFSALLSVNQIVL